MSRTNLASSSACTHAYTVYRLCGVRQHCQLLSKKSILANSGFAHAKVVLGLHVHECHCKGMLGLQHGQLVHNPTLQYTAPALSMICVEAYLEGTSAVNDALDVVGCRQ